MDIKCHKYFNNTQQFENIMFYKYIITVNSNIAMDDFHTLQSYQSYTLYCDSIISSNYEENIECKQ